MQLVLEVFCKCLYNQCERRGILLDSIFLKFCWNRDQVIRGRYDTTWKFNSILSLTISLTRLADFFLRSSFPGFLHLTCPFLRSFSRPLSTFYMRIQISVILFTMSGAYLLLEVYYWTLWTLYVEVAAHQDNHEARVIMNVKEYSNPPWRNTSLHCTFSHNCKWQQSPPL